MDCKELEKTFDSFGRRIIYAFKSTFPKFIPIDDCNVSVESQK